MAELELTRPQLRALRTLNRMRRATLGGVKRAYAREYGVKLKSATLARLWAHRLIRFGWFTDTYDITPLGEAVIGRADASALPLAA